MMKEKYPGGTALVMIVFPTPAPFSVMPLVIVSMLVHVAEPDGTETVSPGLAAATAALTCAKEGLTAMIVAAEATSADPLTETERMATQSKVGDVGNLIPV
jgi:hypothetical protein